MFCGLDLGGLSLAGTFSFEDESQEGGSMVDFMNPCGCRDSEGIEAIFRPMSYSDSTDHDDWNPPLYRDKSLLSSPSQVEEEHTVDIVPDIPSPTSTRKEVSTSDDHNESTIEEENKQDDFLNPIPSDFLPPRHSFSRSFEQRDEKCEVSQGKASATVSSHKEETRIDGLLPTDVLCGRGMNTSVHPGTCFVGSVFR